MNKTNERKTNIPAYIIVINFLFMIITSRNVVTNKTI